MHKADGRLCTRQATSVAERGTHSKPHRLIATRGTSFAKRRSGHSANRITKRYEAKHLVPFLMRNISLFHTKKLYNSHSFCDTNPVSTTTQGIPNELHAKT